ncbi:MAG: calcium-binding protein [Microcoleaceae cyanobacterium MO_207.B10]|nr:calcium-binding protein [Microcoleaceae cyanobacterium MO_207.B10]
MVTLTEGDDIFDQDESGNIAPDTILALGGDDLIFTSTLGGSLVRGADGRDTLIGRGPNDTLEGGEGEDSIDLQAPGSLGFGDADNDTIQANLRSSLYGGAGDDLLRGVADGNWFSGNQGEDTILGGARGRDSIYGGRGDDTIGVFLTEVSTSFFDFIDFSDLGIDISTNEGNNFLSANRDDDLAVGIGDRDTIYGGKDNDTVVGVGSEVYLSGDGGNDTVAQLNEATTLTFNTTATALMSVERSTLLGGAGDDSIQGAVGPFGDGRNLLDGGEGDDTIRGQAARDTLVGGEGNDFIRTGLLAENEEFFGANGLALNTPGYSGQNRLDGGEGNDTLVAGFLNDTMIGGQGNDCLSGVFNRGEGGDGNDTIDASLTTAGQITLSGGGGDDRLIGNTNAGVTNFFDGGEGNDFIEFGNSSNDRLIGSDAGNDTILAGSNGTAPFLIEDTQGSNTLRGSLFNDTLITGAGDDSIVGGTEDEGDPEDALVGADSISAGAGDDVIFGRGGTDTIIGGAGDDYIAPGLNSTGDSLIGGQGNDSFVYFDRSLENSVIQDFDSADDRILLSRAGFSLVASNRNRIIASADFVAIDPGDNYQNSDARSENPVIIYERNPVRDPGAEVEEGENPVLAGSGLLKYDPSGNGGPDDLSDVITIARLNGTPNLLQSDILII